MKNCYLCGQECFEYLCIVWCQNMDCENSRYPIDSHLPHPVITFLGAVEKGEIICH